MFYPATEQVPCNTFDDFFNKEVYESSGDERMKRENSEESLELFPLNPGKDHDSISPLDQPSESLPQPWRKGLWQMMVGKTRKTTATPPSGISPAHLVVNDNFAVRSPRSTTQYYETKISSPSRLRQMLCPKPNIGQSIARDMTLSPSPMYSRPFVDDASGYAEAWPREFQNFNLQLNDDSADVIAIPQNQYAQYSPFSSKQPRRAQMTCSPTRLNQRSATMHHFGGTNIRHVPHQAAHELSHALNANINATEQNTFCNSSHQMDSTFQFVSEEPYGIARWTTESVNSSDSSQNSHHSQEARFIEPLPAQDWWSPAPTYNHNLVHQASRDNFAGLVQPQPRRVTHSVLSQDTNGENEYPSLEHIGIAIPYHPPEPQEPVPIQYHNHVNPLATYPSFPPPVSHEFEDESPFRTPRRARAPMRTPSPPMSPTQRPARLPKQRSPSRRDTSQHRRKSIHKSGPVKDTETPRHRSTSRPPRTPKTPKTPKTPHDAFGSMGFVNFTPKDASKLLSDVAPSGSSKTRARREQEARDKRKKLSEAALNAVRDAGGDVRALERAILI